MGRKEASKEEKKDKPNLFKTNLQLQATHFAELFLQSLADSDDQNVYFQFLISLRYI